MDNKAKQLKDLQKRSEKSEFWQNTTQAQIVMKQISELKSEIDNLVQLKKRAQDALDLAKMNEESIEKELEQELNIIEKSVSALELSTLLSGQYDRGNAILSIHSGMGGVDSQDWAAMLERMYLRWAEQIF